MDYTDIELTNHLRDNDEVVQDLLYEKYKFIIDYRINKYRRVFLALGIDINEARSDAELAFSYAIYHYTEDKKCSLPSFITLCVDRKIRVLIKKYETTKNKVLNSCISYDNDDEVSIDKFIGDEKYEPLKKIIDIDTINYINKNMIKVLSNKELEVYELMIQDYNYIEISNILKRTPKQIDNTIQRIRIKLKNVI